MGGTPRIPDAERQWRYVDIRIGPDRRTNGVGSVGVVSVFLIVRDRQQAQASEIEGLRAELKASRGKAS